MLELLHVVFVLGRESYSNAERGMRNAERGNTRMRNCGCRDVMGFSSYLGESVYGFSTWGDFFTSLGAGFAGGGAQAGTGAAGAIGATIGNIAGAVTPVLVGRLIPDSGGSSRPAQQPAPQPGVRYTTSPTGQLIPIQASSMASTMGTLALPLILVAGAAIFLMSKRK